VNRVADLLAKGIAEPAARHAQAVVEVATMRQVAAARAERMNRALGRFVAMLQDPANLRGGMILLPTPWGAGLRWGLSRNERDALRRWVTVRRVNRRTGRVATNPFSYDEAGRRWWLAMTPADAAQWLEAHPVSADDVLRFWYAPE
jgi:hypothetical protein